MESVHLENAFMGYAYMVCCTKNWFTWSMFLWGMFTFLGVFVFTWRMLSSDDLDVMQTFFTLVTCEHFLS